jgi:hypothetical protein
MGKWVAFRRFRGFRNKDMHSEGKYGLSLKIKHENKRIEWSHRMKE